jgi:anti-anti-sigma factor
MPSQLFTVIPDDRYVVLQLQVTSMDIDACDELQALIAEQLETRVVPVVLDLSRAKFLPSLAIGALVNVKKRLDAAGSDLTIVGLGANIRRAMELSNLHRIFHMVDHLEQVTV